MVKGERGKCGDCVHYTLYEDGKMRCSYYRSQPRGFVPDEECRVDNKEHGWGFNPKTKTMIQKGDKVMHLTGDSVIRQNGEGYVIDFSIIGVVVMWDNGAFIELLSPSTNRCHPVPEQCLSVVKRSVSASIMSTTNRLRWMKTSVLAGRSGVLTSTSLQQYWEDNQGNGEWRDVPTENEEAPATGSFKIEGTGSVVSELKHLMIDGVIWDVIEPKGLPSLIGYEGTVKLERSKKQ